MTAAGRLATIAILAALLVGCGGRPAPRVEATDAAATWSYTVPAGTGDRMDRGEDVDVLPAALDAAVGDVLTIVNEDDRGHVVGLFFVGPGETLTQRFASPGTYRGRCSVHPSGEVTITVQE